MKAPSPHFDEAGPTGHAGSKVDGETMQTDGEAMQNTGLTLAPGVNVASAHDTVRSGLGIVGLTAIGLAAATMPLAWIVITAVAMACAWSLGTTVAYLDRPRPDKIRPESILSREIRDAYQAVLSAFSELDRAVTEAPRLRAEVAPSLERCRAAVALGGQMARHANLLQQYLERHDPTHIRAEIARMRETRDGATDVPLSHAADARARQLATYDEIIAQRDLIRARLELLRAALESFTATLVKLRGVDRKRLMLGGPPVIGRLEEACR